MVFSNWGGSAHTENIVSKLRVLQTQSLELLLGLGTQSMRARSPETCDRSANSNIVVAGESVDITSICDLALGCGVDAVDLGAGKRLEAVDAKLLGERVDARVLE